MVKYDFDEILERRGTGSLKWDHRPKGYEHVLPLSLADMDFKAPAEVTQALVERARQGVYGYTVMEEPDYQAIRDWLLARHGEKVPPEWLLATPGVIYAMRAAQYVLTKPGDKIVVMPPVHTPFFVTASRFDRQVLTCPLSCDEDGFYSINYDLLEEHFARGARLLLLCNPHNPVGRVWSEAEISQLADLCQQYDVYIISDEIHRDIILPGAKLTALHSQPGLAERTVTVISPSKTFNMGGFHSATAIIPDPQLKAAVRQRLSDYGHSCGRPSLFSIVAQTAAYQHGGPWLDQLVAYLLGNFRIMLDKIKDLPLKASLPQATYMLWVDCQELGLDTDQLNALMLDQAAVQVELGHIYDSAEYMHYHGPQTHMRLNAAMPKSQIIQAMDGIRQAVLSVI